MASCVLSLKDDRNYSKSFATTAVDTTANTVTVPQHGLQNGDEVKFSTTTTIPAGLLTTRTYYVVSAADNTFKVSLTAGGSAVDITSQGAGTHTVKKVVPQIHKRLRVGVAGKKEFMAHLVNLLHAADAGLEELSMDVMTDGESPVAAAGEIALTHANLDENDTVTIGGVTLTAKTAASDNTIEFSIGSDADEDGENLAATINRNLTLSRIMTASNDAGTVTLTMKVKGTVGNCIVMSTSDATAYGLTAFTGGTGGPQGSVTTYSFGL